MEEGHRKSCCSIVQRGLVGENIKQDDEGGQKETGRASGTSKARERQEQILSDVKQAQSSKISFIEQ